MERFLTAVLTLATAEQGAVAGVEATVALEEVPAAAEVTVAAQVGLAARVDSVGAEAPEVEVQVEVVVLVEREVPAAQVPCRPRQPST